MRNQRKILLKGKDGARYISPKRFDIVEANSEDSEISPNIKYKAKISTGRFIKAGNQTTVG